MKAKDVLKILGITRPTLTKYVKNGTIKIRAVNNGRYVYDEDSVYAFIGLKNKRKNKINVIYSRISNPPKKYVIEQEQRILNYCSNNGITISRTFQDVKSGMNFNRSGLAQMIECVVKGEIELIVIENKDRLCRFGFELFESFCKFYNTKILICNNLTEKSYEEELTEDLIAIIHYFSMKSYSHRRTINKLKKNLEKEISNND